MSRIGRNPIVLPDGIDVKIHGDYISVKGSAGELKWGIPPGIKVSVHNKIIAVERLSDAKGMRALHGTARNIISNMLKGIGDGYQRVLEITGVGYRAQVQGNKVVFTLGYSHPVEFNLPEGISAEVDKKQTQLTIKGIDKQSVGEVAAKIRLLRPPDTYKGKGVRYADERIKLKAGKTGKK